MSEAARDLCRQVVNAVETMRLERGWSREDLARAAGLDADQVSAVLDRGSDAVAAITLDWLAVVSAAFQLSAGELLAESGCR